MKTKLLTEGQVLWLLRKTINVGGFYSFPALGFTVYDKPKYSSEHETLETNPFTRSLAGEFFLVKEKVDGFCLGNFATNPKGRDWWISEEELSRRGLLVALILFVICFIPFVAYNLFNHVIKTSQQ